MQAADRVDIATVFATDEDFELRIDGASVSDEGADHLLDCRVDGDERMTLEEFLVDVERQEAVGVVAGNGECRLGEVVGTEGSEAIDGVNVIVIAGNFGAEGGSNRVPVIDGDLDDPTLKNEIGARAYEDLHDALELLDGAGAPFDREAFLAGKLSPVFFGSALTNFGVEPFLDAFIHLAPAPRNRITADGDTITPDSDDFSGFVFKIQANMDPRHRDRIAFFRLCSGRFERGMQAVLGRTGAKLTLSKSLMFMAQERSNVEEAYAGDIVGLWDSGQLHIGDTLFTGKPVAYEGIPRFSPEHFVRVVLRDPLKRKQLKKGLDELSEEGAVQVFYDLERMERDPILGAVGRLQFDVVQNRLETEYNVRVTFDSLPYQHARWIEGELDADEMARRSGTLCLRDIENRLIVLFSSEWMMRRIIDDYKDKPVEFIAAVQPGRKA